MPETVADETEQKTSEKTTVTEQETAEKASVTETSEQKTAEEASETEAEEPEKEKRRDFSRDGRERNTRKNLRQRMLI